MFLLYNLTHTTNTLRKFIMALFLKSGTSYRVTNKESMDLHEMLPAGNYVIKKDPMSGPRFLEGIDSFEIKGKIYGDTEKTARRILNTFQDRPASTGVMLTGEKGSGKSLLAKMLSVNAAQMAVPTIVINAPWSGDEFNSFLQKIDQPCVILFDEFEKVYDRDDQESILTLLDGVFPSKKLFILTCNDKWRVDSHMRNRPGRIYYMMEYKGLDQNFIVEYCMDNLDATEHIHSICKIASMFDQFNFDMLKALVEEMNRYDETPQEALKFLNAKPEFSDEARYDVELQVGGIDIPKNLADTNWHGNPFTQTIDIDYKVFGTGKKKENTATDFADLLNDVDDDFKWEHANFSQADLKQVDPQIGKFVFVNEDGNRAVLSKVKEKTPQYWDAF